MPFTGKKQLAEDALSRVYQKNSLLQPHCPVFIRITDATTMTIPAISHTESG